MKKLLLLFGMIAGFNGITYAAEYVLINYVQNTTSINLLYSPNGVGDYTMISPYKLFQVTSSVDSNITKFFVISDINHNEIYKYTITNDVINSRVIHYDKIYNKLNNCYFIDTKKTTPTYFINIQYENFNQDPNKIGIELVTSTTFLDPMIMRVSPSESTELGNLCKKYL